MAPTSIDGTEITGATIDGQEVQEITVGGDVVFTAEQIIDDFEDGNINGWVSENVESIQFENGHNGGTAVELNTLGGSYPPTSRLITSELLPSSFSDGDIVEWYWKWDYDGKIRFTISDSNDNIQVEAQIRPNGLDGDHFLSSSTETEDSNGEANSNTWYRNELQLQTNSITWEMYDLNDNLQWSNTVSNDGFDDFDRLVLSCSRNYSMDWAMFDDIEVL